MTRSIFGILLAWCIFNQLKVVIDGEVAGIWLGSSDGSGLRVSVGKLLGWYLHGVDELKIQQQQTTEYKEKVEANTDSLCRV